MGFEPNLPARFRHSSAPARVSTRVLGAGMPASTSQQPVCVHCSAHRAVSKIGGSGEIRTHGPRKRSSDFKSGAINRALPRFLKIGVPGRIQTYESNALQAQPLDHSGTET